MPKTSDPRNYFLNEKHELARGEKTGGGPPAPIVNINWQDKSSRIHKSLNFVREKLRSSKDPLRARRYFVLARPPTHKLLKASKSKAAQGGVLEARVSYSKGESRVFSRLGMDLIQVNRDGSATIHARPDIIEHLFSSSEMLHEFGPREKARWTAIESFDLVPPDFRYDREWLDSIDGKSEPVIVELQPLITSAEADQVIHTIAALLRERENGGVKGVGTDFSGRHWLRARMTSNTIIEIAKSFFSVQSIHPPLISVVTDSVSRREIGSRPHRAEPVADVAQLPCVAVVDTGIPAEHRLLARYRRGRFAQPGLLGIPAGDHGSFVASRIVFGDQDYTAGAPRTTPQGQCAFYDVNLALDPTHIDEKSVTSALDAVIGTAQDIRVFNLSFDNAKPLSAELPVMQQEKLNLMQELDNLIFARDIIVVVAAGNSPQGIIPANAYPNHYDDPQWALGTWPQCFNAITCGGSVDRPSASGLVSEEGAPSPFCKVGLGLCDSPKPDFFDNAGNSNDLYQFKPGLGVWGTTADGYWEDKCGTSYAAPLLAREAAFAIDRLRSFCDPSSKPFAATVKAFLAATARPYNLPTPYHALADRTLGRGRASATRLFNPLSGSALFVWQGVFENHTDIIRVQIPVPRSWWKAAGNPRLRLIVAWNSPVNAAVKDLWASRRVVARLHVRPETPALKGEQRGHKTYPLIDRSYDLRNLPTGVTARDDSFLLQLNYEEAAEYYPGLDFSPQQRVAFVAELFDASEKPIDPNQVIQSLPVAASLTRLSVVTSEIRNPVLIKSRL